MVSRVPRRTCPERGCVGSRVRGRKKSTGWYRALAAVPRRWGRVVVRRLRSRPTGSRDQLISSVSLILGVIAVTVATTEAADWPQWRGPRRDGISSEVGWRTSWTAGTPRRLWTAQVGEGFSSVAVKDGRVYTMGNAGGMDVVTCLTADTGRVVWQHKYPCPSGDHGG